jgi:quercetin dioxygenase-like cupin family protein
VRACGGLVHTTRVDVKEHEMTIIPGVVQTGLSLEPLRIRLRSEDSGGDVGLVEMAMAAGSTGPPLHVHPTHGEGFYVLDGELTFQVGDDVVSGGPGTWVFAPRDTPHTLANLGTRDGRLLCVFAPAGFERRFERMVAEQTGQQIPDELAAAEQATRMVGPPLSAPPR